VRAPQHWQHRISARQCHFDQYPQLELPRVIRADDIANICVSDGMADADFTTLTGTYLANGPPVTGVIVNIDEFASVAEVYATMESYQSQQLPVILVAQQMNLSHDPLIARAAGVIIENAAIVSHGAQRARELGKGAIGGILTKRLKTGVRATLNPSERTLQRIIND